MRASTDYAAGLDHVASGRAHLRIGYLGDQSLYTWMAAAWSPWRHLFHTLPCEWNRQLSMHFGFNNASVHSCPRRCALLHANWQPVKCIAPVMQMQPSCATWATFQAQLGASPAQASAARRDPASLCALRLGPQGRAFRRGIQRFFADCCANHSE